MSQAIAIHYGVKAESAMSSDFDTSAGKTSSQMVGNWMKDFYGIKNYIRDWHIALENYLTRWDDIGNYKDLRCDCNYFNNSTM